MKSGVGSTDGDDVAQTALRPWTLPEFFAWQERQEERYELVDGVPLRMMAGASNRHDAIVMNLLLALGNRLRGARCTPFTGDGAVQTRPGQIRRPDAGVDCGARDPEGYVAVEPKLLVEVLSPSTRDFDTFEKLAEYKALPSVDHILYVEPNRAEVALWSRDAERNWSMARIEDTAAAIELPSLGMSLPLAEIYDGIELPATTPLRTLG